MDQDNIIKGLGTFSSHPEIIEAIQFISKSKLKTGKDRYILLEKAKDKLYPFSGNNMVLMAINKIDSIIS